MSSGDHEPGSREFQRLFEAVPGAAVVLTPPDWRVVAANDAYLRVTNLSRSDLVGQRLFELFPVKPGDPRADDRTKAQLSLVATCTTGAVQQQAIQRYDSFEATTKSNAQYWQATNVPVLGSDGEVIFVIHYVEDVTALVHMEQAGRDQEVVAANLRDKVAEKGEEALQRDRELQESNHQLSTANAFLDSIVENIPDMIFLKDAQELRFARINRAGERLLGVSRDELIGKNDFDFFQAEQAEYFQAKDREVLSKKQLLDIPEESLEAQLQERWLHTKKIPILDSDGQPQYLLGISEDITERKVMADRLHLANEQLAYHVETRTAELVAANAKLQSEILERQRTAEALHRSEEQLRQAQKMEAIGRLAGGIAHDFNNLLSVILSYSSMAMSDTSHGEALHADLAEVMKAGERAADLTRQLLAFSRRQVLAPKVVNLNALLESMEKMLQRIIGEDVDLRFLPGKDLGKAKIDPGQFEQVIINLVVNARDAMPDGGTLTIETTNVEFDPVYVGKHADTRPGLHVLVAVSDTGIGMDRETQARIYEPFFTTKEKGKGTGLGLATVFGIVQQSGGTIWHYSEVGKGTTFKIYLPHAEESGVVESDRRPSPIPATGKETILLVEDEEQVRVLACEVLRRFGYNVMYAQNGWEALLMCERHAGTIDLIVTDVVMPKMSGRELADRVRKLRPDTRILFMSGYTDDTVVHHGVIEADYQFLQKPITPNSLASKVREVLDLPLPTRG